MFFLLCILIIYNTSCFSCNALLPYHQAWKNSHHYLMHQTDRGVAFEWREIIKAAGGDQAAYFLYQRIIANETLPTNALDSITCLYPENQEVSPEKNNKNLPLYIGKSNNTIGKYLFTENSRGFCLTPSDMESTNLITELLSALICNEHPSYANLTRGLHSSQTPYAIVKINSYQLAISYGDTIILYDEREKKVFNAYRLEQMSCVQHLVCHKGKLYFVHTEISGKSFIKSIAIATTSREVETHTTINDDNIQYCLIDDTGECPLFVTILNQQNYNLQGLITKNSQIKKSYNLNSWQAKEELHNEKIYVIPLQQGLYFIPHPIYPFITNKTPTGNNVHIKTIALTIGLYARWLANKKNPAPVTFQSDLSDYLNQLPRHLKAKCESFVSTISRQSLAFMSN